MIPITIHEAPELDSFTPLDEHQAQTPESFHDGKPVLHYHAVGARALTTRSHLDKFPFFWAPSTSARSTLPLEENKQMVNGAATNGYTIESSTDKSEISQVVDVFINTSNLTIFNPSTSKGLAIAYPSIGLHAIQTLPATSSEVKGLYMQLEFHDPQPSQSYEDDEPETIDLTLIPPPSSSTTASDSSAIPTSIPPIQSLYQALTTCSNLNPTPMLDGDYADDASYGDRIILEGNAGYEGISGLPEVILGRRDGELPPPFPGSGGWITAENVEEFFDEDGNWIKNRNTNEGGLGEGAGRIRRRSEIDNGAEEDGDKVEIEEKDEAKWRKTEGVDEVNNQ